MIILTMPNARSRADVQSRQQILEEYRLDLCEDWGPRKLQSFTDRQILCCRGDLLNEALLRQMLSSKALIDLDMADWERLPKLVDPERLILSLHLDSFDEARIRKFIHHPQKAAYYKLVVAAKSFSELLKTYELLSSVRGRRFIFLVMGKWAVFQRALYRIFASQGCYAAFADPIVPGQPTYAQLSDIWTILAKANPRIYAIVGGAQVNKSLSFLRYNRHFLDAKIPAVMLPIPALDSRELMLVLSFLASRYELGGMAITSPFKKSLSQLFGGKGSIINSLRFDKQIRPTDQPCPDPKPTVSVRNTDLDALRLSLQALSMELRHRILIYGSGACAEAFSLYLRELGFTQIAIQARNRERCALLRQRYGLQSPNQSFYDLLINASFLGQNPADETQFLPAFAKLIDLPYIASGEATALSAFARDRQIPHIDGAQFWEYQFAVQKDFLLS